MIIVDFIFVQMKHLHWKTFIFFLCSLLFLYVACSDGDHSGDVDLTGYVEAQALITNKILGRVTRYGVQQHRYSLRIQQQEGETTLRSNVQLSGNHEIDDTLTILYHPQDNHKPIVLKQ